MAERYGFFDAVVTNGTPDRIYGADDVNEIFRGILSDGIFRLYQNALKVTAGSGLTVNVNTGKAIIKDHWYLNTTVKNLTLNTAHATLPRYSSVVLRYKRADRSITLGIIDGNPASSPVLPVLTQNSDTYEIRLADILVSAGVTTLTNDNITDVRTYTSGIVDTPALAYRRYNFTVTAHESQRYFDIPDSYALTNNTSLAVYADGILCPEADYHLVINEVEGNMMVVFVDGKGKAIGTVMDFIMIN